MIGVLQMLNQDKDRCVLIGRSAFNELLFPSSVLQTADYDVVCPDLATADECSALLLRHGFERRSATFYHGAHGELDILICDPGSPENALGGFYNAPSLKTLWDNRKRRKGFLVAGEDALVTDKLLHARENQGKDLETIHVYFNLAPHKLGYFIKNVLPRQSPEDREAMLFSLHAALSDDDNAKQLIENAMIDDLEDADPSGFKPQ